MCPGTGMPTPIRWQVRCWRCREQACGGGDVLRAEPLGVLPSRPAGGRTFRWASRQLRFEGTTILCLVCQLSTTWVYEGVALFMWWGSGWRLGCPPWRCGVGGSCSG